MPSKDLRRLAARLDRLCNEVTERPYDHVTRERLFSTIKMLLAHLGQRKRPWKKNELSTLLSRITVEGEAVCKGISSAREHAPFDVSAAGTITNSARALKKTLSLLGQLEWRQPAP
jgi:hypothetical protein